jgi:methyl-accepting chemotaxis protein
MQTKTVTDLFERIGGKDVLEISVDIFYDKVLADERINSFFQTTDVRGLRTKLRTFIASLFGAPVKYTGKDLSKAHMALVKMGLNEEQFIIIGNHLEATLHDLGAPADVIDEVMAMAAATKDEILGTNNLIENTMTQKNYYQEKGNGVPNGAHNPVEELRKKIAVLEKIRNRNEQALDLAIDAIVMIDSKMIITFFNKSAEKLFGYASKELIGQHANVILPPELQHIKDEVITDASMVSISLIIGKGFDIQMKRRDGSVFWANLSASEYKVDGEVHFSIFIKDNTDWIKKEEDLNDMVDQSKAQEEVLRQTMEEITATQEEMERKQIELEGQMQAINSTSACIEFTPDGTIVTANELYLKALKYSMQEIQHKHHSIFCDQQYVNTKTYQFFWDDLRRGKPQLGEFKHFAKDGTEVWMMASYTPVLNRSGEVVKVINLATDITEAKLISADYKGQIDAISKAQAVIEYNMDGTILYANENFLRTFRYSLSEIKAKHHSMFVDEAYVRSAEYKSLWERLNQGEFIIDEFKRYGKGGKEVWLQASYNPILDLNGKPYKVVKYAIDITEFNVALKAVSEFASQLRQGNFDATLDIRSEGDVGKMIEDNLALRDTLRMIMQRVNEVVKTAGEDGNLQARINLSDVSGAWKSLVNSLNQLLQSIAEPIMEFNKIVSEMAQGNLTERFRMAAKGDIKVMAEALNKAIDNLNELLYTIGRNADVVAGSSINMLQKTESMRRNTSEVASAISQMAKGAQDQAQRTDESSRMVEKVKISSSEMEKRANIISKAAEKGQKSSEDGLKIMKTLVSNMTGIKESAQQTSKSIEILTKRAEEIGRTLNVITGIASQTNLLALNAAIEAARAGDAGRGFAVVAEEIRKLAEDSRKSAVEIEKIISDVQKDTQSAGKAIDTMQVSVRDGNTATNEAETIFQEIAHSSVETFSFSKEILDTTSEQKSSIDTVVKNIEQIVVVAEETAAGTQQAASSSQQLSNAMIEIAEGSNKLSGVAAELQAGVNKFKLKKAS